MCSLGLAARLLQNFYFNADCNSFHNKWSIKNLLKIIVKRFFHFNKVFSSKIITSYMKYTINIFQQFLFWRFSIVTILENCFSWAIEAFKVWASQGITACWKLSKCVLEAKTSHKHLNIVSEAKYGTCRSFSVFKDFSLPIFEKVLQKGSRGV